MQVFCIICRANALGVTMVCNFSFLLGAGTSAPAALASLCFDPSGTQISEKYSISRLSQHFAQVDLLSCNCGTIGSSVFWVYFSLPCFSSSDSASLLCFFNCPYCWKLDFWTSFKYFGGFNIINICKGIILISWNIFHLYSIFTGNYFQRYIYDSWMPTFSAKSSTLKSKNINLSGDHDLNAFNPFISFLS